MLARARPVAHGHQAGIAGRDAAVQWWRRPLPRRSSHRGLWGAPPEGRVIGRSEMTLCRLRPVGSVPDKVDMLGRRCDCRTWGVAARSVVLRRPSPGSPCRAVLETLEERQHRVPVALRHKVLSCPAAIGRDRLVTVPSQGASCVAAQVGGCSDDVILHMAAVCHRSAPSVHPSHSVRTGTTSFKDSRAHGSQRWPPPESTDEPRKERCAAEEGVACTPGICTLQAPEMNAFGGRCEIRKRRTTFEVSNLVKWPASTRQMDSIGSVCAG